MYRFLTLIILVSFVLSGLSLPTVQQQEGDGVELRKVIQQVQVLSHQSESGTLDFADTFRSAITALQAVAGLKIIIVKKSTKDGNSIAAIIICFNSPILPEKITELNIDISGSDISISKRLIADTSVILSLDTPPPIA